MTEQEAIQMLERMLDPDPWEVWDLSDCTREALEMAVDALEKQIPRKPKYKAEDRFVKNHFAEYSYCPTCEKEVVAGDMFCVMCGQRICWQEEET